MKNFTDLELAERLYDAACLAQAGRMQSKEEKKRGLNPESRNVSCEFKDLFNEAKAHYVAMAQFLLTNFDNDK